MFCLIKMKRLLLVCFLFLFLNKIHLCFQSKTSELFLCWDNIDIEISYFEHSTSVNDVSSRLEVSMLRSDRQIGLKGDLDLRTSVIRVSSSSRVDSAVASCQSVLEGSIEGVARPSVVGSSGVCYITRSNDCSSICTNFRRDFSDDLELTMIIIIYYKKLYKLKLKRVLCYLQL